MISTNEYFPPVRPPRSSKVNKDTSGRLINIIAELSVSKSNDRKKKMAELKNDAKTSDTRIVRLISNNKEQLSLTMRMFSSISTKINSAQQCCYNIKMKLLSCQKFLNCKRDEIKALWFESIEHREVINILNEIEDLKKVPKHVNELLKRKEFYEASERVVSSLTLLEKRSGIDSLRDLKIELSSLKMTLHENLLQELNNLLYIPTPDFFNMYYGEKWSERDNAKGGNNKREDKENEKSEKGEKLFSLLKCLSLLEKLHETIDVVKDNCTSMLSDIVNNSSELVYENLQNPAFFVISYQNDSLRGLAELIIHQFKLVAVNFESLLDGLKIINDNKGANMRGTNMSKISFDIADVYSKIEATLEFFVSSYIDLHSGGSLCVNNSLNRSHTFSKLSHQPTDISSYFLCKSISRSKKHSLFKFDGSSYKAYLKEKKKIEENHAVSHQDKILKDKYVCPPCAKNITVLYKTLMNFISELEASLKMSPDGTHCSLHAFLTDTVLLFIQNDVNNTINSVLEKASESLQTFSYVTSVDELKAISAKVPIFQSTIKINSVLLELEELLFLLPDYSSHLFQIALNTLQSYQQLCFSAYKDITHDPETKKFSLTWAADKDINRFFRSLPNWPKKNSDVSESATSHEEAPEMVRLRNKAEIGLLMRNVVDRDSVELSEIFYDHFKLENLALMHESMEWFSSRICLFANHLPDESYIETNVIAEKSDEEKNDDGDRDEMREISSSVKNHFIKIAKEFDDLADTCLLVLHLEIRSHCFFHLLPLSKEAAYMNNNKECELREIKKLNDDLSKIDESLAPYLQRTKMNYIFEGLGELLATMLINSVANIKKINENGVKIMARNIFFIQQNLAGITLTREVALDRARQYFDLLNHSLEDIFNQIVEEGPQFQEQEYFAIIQLLYNSKEVNLENESLESYRGKLRQILDGVAVSV